MIGASCVAHQILSSRGRLHWTDTRMTPTPKRCKDCEAEAQAFTEWEAAGRPGLSPTAPPATVRPAPHPGPRCATHHRAKRKKDRNASHERRVKSVYGIDGSAYHELYEYQGRLCAICQRATGASKRLAVDHDHKCCAERGSCGKCVRGLLCGPCNSLLAHMRDDKAMARRIFAYLVDPPYQRYLRKEGGSIGDEG